MKLNNKGFALTSIIYMLIVLFLMILLLILANLATRKVVLDKIKNEVKENLNQGGQLAQNTYTVTFDPTIGQVSQTSKQVTYGEPYGELPTPTREGYKFMGWRGKNLLNMQEWLDSITRTVDGTMTKTQNSITLTATANDSYTYSSYYNIAVKPNTIYTLSWQSDNNNNGHIYVFVNNNQTTTGYMFNTNNATSKSLTFTTPSDAKYITFRVGVQNSNNTITYSDIQLEEGNAQTTYEQYEEYIKDTIVTKQENHTLYAKWTPKYTITYDGNGATSGTTANSTHAYEEKKQLTPNGFERTGYTFVGWSKDPNAEMTNIINDSNEYNCNNINGNTYTSVNNQYTVNPPFESGETYQLFVDVKGIGTLTNYFYGQTGYLRVSEVKTSDGKKSISGDGSNTALLTNEYTKYSAHFTLGSNGDGTLKKYLLFRIFEGSSTSIKNIELYKTNSTEMIFKDEQHVKNLSDTPGDTITLYAIWQANS